METSLRHVPGLSYSGTPGRARDAEGSIKKEWLLSAFDDVLSNFRNL